MAYESLKDSGHEPFADYRYEKPRNKISVGPSGIHVELASWGPMDDWDVHVFNRMQANWGDHAVKIDAKLEPDAGKLTFDEMDQVENCFAGRALPQVLEMFSFVFYITGISRACTHQIVRTRIGANFTQQGGRDNDWRHHNWTMPETIHRACLAQMGTRWVEKDCIDDWEPIKAYQRDYQQKQTLVAVIDEWLDYTRNLYAALVDAGIPWQDARYLLPIGMQTYLSSNYTYPALAGFLANRLEHVMMWETNCVAQLMLREIKMKCPPLFSKYLGSHSDKAGVARFATLDSWHPDGKHPIPNEQTGDVVFIKRQNRPEQNPFFVLHPDSMAGGPIVWIPTDGTYPHKEAPIGNP